jgi:hypothetical protein
MINLVIVPDVGFHDVNDVHKIVELIQAQCTDIRPVVCYPKNLVWYRWLCLTRPTIFVSFKRLRRFKPLRGKIFHGQKLSKSQQYEMMEEKGFPTLKWQRITPQTSLSSDEWGERVVVKPELGKAGEQITVQRIEDVRWEKDTPLDGGTLAQELISTGSEPISFRCLTLFGKTLLLNKNVSPASHSNPESNTEDNIIATLDDRYSKSVNDPEVIHFAEQLGQRVFPDIPLLGIDIIRCAKTQKLYVLEANPFGLTWHFSSKGGLHRQAESNTNYEKQFGAFGIAAKRLIEVARERAC